MYPNQTNTLAGFNQEFQEHYGTNPRFTEVVVLADNAEAVSALQVEVTEISRTFDPAPSIAVSSVALDEASAALTQEIDARVQGEQSRGGATTSTVQASTWAPGPVTWTTGQQVGTQAVVQIASAYSNLEGHWSQDMPGDWGLEIEANLYNSDVVSLALGIGRPDCASNPNNSIFTYLDDFWAARYNDGNTGIDSWSVQTEAGTGIDHNTIGFYWDWDDSLDDCGRQSMGVGIAYPDLIPANAAGTQAFIVQLRAPRGWPTSSPFGATYQATYNSCEFGGPLTFGPASWCMGIPPLPAWPYAPDLPSSMIVNPSRGFDLPGCYMTYQSWVDDIAEVYDLPLSDCGISPEPTT